MDVDAGKFRHAALQDRSASVSRPSLHSQCADAMGLQRQEALEEQERLQRRARRRIALEHRLHVALGGGDDPGIGLIGLLADLAHLHGAEISGPPAFCAS